MVKPMRPLLRTGISFALVPVGPGVSRDLSPGMLGGGSWCLVLPKAEGTCSTFPCLRCVATGCCRAQQPEALPVPGHTGPLASPSHWPPSYPSIPQPSGVFPLPRRSVVGFGGRLSGTAPTSKWLGRVKPHNSAMAPSQGWLGCSSSGLKKDGR